MTALTIRPADQALAKSLVAQTLTDKYVVVTRHDDGGKNPLVLFSVSTRSKEFNDIFGKNGAALNALNDIKLCLSKHQNDVLHTVATDDDQNETIAVIDGAGDKGRYILLANAAQKIHDTARAKVGIISKFFNCLWSWLTCCHSNTQLAKIDRVYADIRKQCQAEYNKLVVAEDAAKKAAETTTAV